jgi:hypothetical protein
MNWEIVDSGGNRGTEVWDLYRYPVGAGYLYRYRQDVSTRDVDGNPTVQKHVAITFAPE